jgi:hypothetical protein
VSPFFSDLWTFGLVLFLVFEFSPALLVWLFSCSFSIGVLWVWPFRPSCLQNGLYLPSSYGLEVRARLLPPRLWGGCRRGYRC